MDARTYVLLFAGTNYHGGAVEPFGWLWDALASIILVWFVTRTLIGMGPTYAVCTDTGSCTA